MKVLVWNCQGLGGSMAVSQLEEINRLHSPDVIFLSETKNKLPFLRKVCRKLKLADVYTVDPTGLSGGLVLFWQQGTTFIAIRSTHCTIEVNFFDQKMNKDWLLVGVYASPNPICRREQWSFISNRIRSWGSSFIIAGDFNDILSPKEKEGGIPRAMSFVQDFRQFVVENSLIDFGFQGRFWTWRRHCEGQPVTLERLDRALCSSDWQTMFPKAICRHLYTFASDHCMLLCDFHPMIMKPNKSFLFDQRWLGKDGLSDAIQMGWNAQVKGSHMFSFMAKIKAVRVNVLKWKNGKHFNAAKRISYLKSQINNAIEFNSDPISIRQLRKDLEEAHKEEELFWMQKSRVNWLKEGDKNTKFFHATVANKRKKNLISYIKKSNSLEWCQDMDEITNEFVLYYSNLFSSSGEPSLLSNYFAGLEARVTNEMNQSLMRPVTEAEIKKAVFSSKSQSAPGPDVR